MFTAVVLCATLAEPDPGEVLMARVSAIAQASVIIRQERQLTYLKELNDGKMQEWEGWWDQEGDHQKLLKVDGIPKRGKPERSEDVDLVGVMRSRFVFRMREPVTPKQQETYCDGRPCFAVAFEPKPASESAPIARLSDEAELIVGHLRGTAYVDARHLYLVHIEGSAGNFWKNIAHIKEVQVMYHQVWNNDLGIPVLNNADIFVKGSALLLSVNQRRIYKYFGYQFTYPSPAPAP